ncbi:MAG: hypothetical protein INF98_03515 [Roseomonas sp.]|nr:hypothetical protein [Roseomonas sp.]
MTRGSKLRALSAKVREGKALELLNPDAVLALAATAASHGAELVRLTLETPADLRLTEAAKTLASVLAREGLQLAWEPRLLSGKTNPTGTDLMIYEPVITWQKDR